MRKLEPHEKEQRKVIARTRSIAWGKANPERVKAAKARYRATAKAKTTEKAYAEANRQAARDAKKRWRQRNPDKVLAQTRKHQKANPALWSFYASQRKSLKLSRIHPDHNVAIEKFLHERAATLTELTGWKHGVDHIIPLKKGGWHHHDNLQVLPLDLNSAKNDNPFWEHDEYCSWRDVPSHLWPTDLVDNYQQLLAA